jgi:hypothetical protein
VKTKPTIPVIDPRGVKRPNGSGSEFDTGAALKRLEAK